MKDLRGFPCKPLLSADFEQASDFAVRGCCVCPCATGDTGDTVGAAAFEVAAMGLAVA